MRTIEQVRDFFKNDVYATGTTGIEIVEARPGYAKVSLQVDARHMNAAGRVMGAVYYTLADFAFAVGRPVNGRVMHDDNSSVCSQAGIHFNAVRPCFQRFAEGGHGVFRIL